MHQKKKKPCSSPLGALSSLSFPQSQRRRPELRLGYFDYAIALLRRCESRKIKSPWLPTQNLRSTLIELANQIKTRWDWLVIRLHTWNGIEAMKLSPVSPGSMGPWSSSSDSSTLELDRGPERNWGTETWEMTVEVNRPPMKQRKQRRTMVGSPNFALGPFAFNFIGKKVSSFLSLFFFQFNGESLELGWELGPSLSLLNTKSVFLS